jgi:hypothetical protein
VKAFQEIALTAARDAIVEYMDQQDRPGRVKPGEIDKDGFVKTPPQTRSEDLQVVGIYPPSLAAINDFHDALTNTPAALSANGVELRDPLYNGSKRNPPKDLNEYIGRIAESILMRNQVTRFANIELFPLRTSVRSGLLGSSDFSSSAIRERYEAGVKLAQDQIVVAEYGKDPATKRPKRDLKFVAPPNE